MPGIHSQLRAAGFYNIKLSDPKGTHWRLLKATSSTGLQETQSHIVFFKRGATFGTVQAAQDACKGLIPQGELYPLIDTSAELRKNLSLVSKRLGAKYPALTVRQLFVNSLLRNASVRRWRRRSFVNRAL